MFSAGDDAGVAAQAQALRQDAAHPELVVHPSAPLQPPLVAGDVAADVDGVVQHGVDARPEAHLVLQAVSLGRTLVGGRLGAELLRPQHREAGPPRRWDPLHGEVHEVVQGRQALGGRRPVRQVPHGLGEVEKLTPRGLVRLGRRIRRLQHGGRSWFQARKAGRAAHP